MKLSDVIGSQVVESDGQESTTSLSINGWVSVAHSAAASDPIKQIIHTVQFQESVENHIKLLIKQQLSQHMQQSPLYDRGDGWVESDGGDLMIEFTD